MALSRSSRSPLMAALRRCIRDSARLGKTRESGWAARGPAFFGGGGIPGKPDAGRGAVDPGRRDFLKTAALLGAGALLPGCRKAAAAPPRVAIVGAGLAGLSAAHHLRKGGIDAEVFEAGPRAGGRILTLRDAVGPGLYTEAGGEFIDSSHADMLSLAREFGLTLSDMQGVAYAGLRADAWHFGGRLRSEAEVAAAAREHPADVVVLTVPFPVLRQVDLRLELPPLKRRAIAELGMGQNAKLFLGYSTRAWRKNGYVGNFFADRKPQSGWDSTQTQSGEAGGLTVFQGGRAGLDLGRGSPQSHAESMAADLEVLYPGSRKGRNDKAGVYFWPGHPLALGSYACYRPGQWTGLGGEEGKPAGDLYFAGEHCSADFQGYMNGAAETGRGAAEAILTRFGRNS